MPRVNSPAEAVVCPAMILNGPHRDEPEPNQAAQSNRYEDDKKTSQRKRHLRPVSRRVVFGGNGTHSSSQRSRRVTVGQLWASPRSTARDFHGSLSVKHVAHLFLTHWTNVLVGEIRQIC